MSRRSRNTLGALILLAVLASVWLLSSEPWGLGVYQLLMFTAPGALLGLGASWMAHAATQSRWTWRSSRRAALLGAGCLPPLLAFMVALEGNARPQRLLVGFVYAAWVALIGGAAVALVRASETRARLEPNGTPSALRASAPASPPHARATAPTSNGSRAPTASSP